MQEGCSVFANYSAAHRFVHDSLSHTLQDPAITNIPAPYKIYVFTWAYMYNNQVKETETWLQSTSQIVETETVFLEVLRKCLTFPLFTFVLTQMCPSPSRCWATRILKHWDDCNTQIIIGEGENHTSVSRFVTSIVHLFLNYLFYCFVFRL